MATMVGRDTIKRDQMSLSNLLKKFQRGQIDKNHPLQRKADQWTDEAKTGLAASILSEEDIDSIKICEQIIDRNSFVLWLIDGLQRLTVLDSYRNNAFAIGKTLDKPIIYYQGVDKDGNIGVIEYNLVGKRYKDLPDELKERFDDYPVDVVKHLDCTDEDIAHHMARYNRQTNMNVNQRNILVAWKVASSIKDLAGNRFFLDCGDFSPKERTKEIPNRIICESIMTMFHLDDWKKSKQMSIYLNDKATKEEFDTFEDELSRLYKIIDQDTTGKLFNAKNSFIWFAAFHKFTAFGLEDSKFADFLKEFQRTLHSKTFAEYENKSFDTYDSGKGTKDKKVVMDKLDILEKLMKEYLHIKETDKVEEEIDNKVQTETIKEINEETAIKTENNVEESDSKSCESDPILEFVQKIVSRDISDEDIEEYQEFMDAFVDINSDLYKQCSMALMALTAYAYRCEKDIELGEWMQNCQSRKWQNLSPSQEVNFKYMKRNFDNYVSAVSASA